MVPDHLEEVAQNITFIKGDVMDFPCLTEIFRKYKNEIDGILHTVGIMGELVLENPHGNVKPWISAGPEKSSALNQNSVLKKAFRNTPDGWKRN